MHIVKAVSFKVASALMFAIMGAQVRYLGGAYPEGQVAFFRALFALIPILIVFGWRGQLRGALRTKAKGEAPEDAPDFPLQGRECAREVELVTQTGGRGHIALAQAGRGARRHGAWGDR